MAKMINRVALVAFCVAVVFYLNCLAGIALEQFKLMDAMFKTQSMMLEHMRNENRVSPIRLPESQACR